MVRMINDYENEYYLLCPSDIKKYPLIYEDCRRLTCSYDKYKKCEDVPDCPAYFVKKEKVENPAPFVLDFMKDFSKIDVLYADCYMAFSLFKSSFVVSPKLYGILQEMGIYGIQFIPVTLLENNAVKYTDFQYVHTYNYLSVLSAKNSRCQEINGKRVSNNLLSIKFNNRKLGKINLENRLIFRFPMERSYFIFHVSVAEKIIAANPVGIRFIKISDMLSGVVLP